MVQVRAATPELTRGNRKSQFQNFTGELTSKVNSHLLTRGQCPQLPTQLLVEKCRVSSEPRCNNLQRLHDLARKPTPKSGPECLKCAGFARQRFEVENLGVRVEVSVFKAVWFGLRGELF